MNEKFKIGDKVYDIHMSSKNSCEIGYEVEIVGTGPDNTMACRNENGKVFFTQPYLLTKIPELKKGDEVFVKGRYIRSTLCLHMVEIDGYFDSFITHENIFIKNQEGKLIPIKPTKD